MFTTVAKKKIRASGYDELLNSIFCILLVVEVFSLQKVIKMLDEVVVGERSGGYAVEAKCRSPIRSTFGVLAV